MGTKHASRVGVELIFEGCISGREGWLPLVSRMPSIGLWTKCLRTTAGTGSTKTVPVYSWEGANDCQILLDKGQKIQSHKPFRDCMRISKLANIQQDEPSVPATMKNSFKKYTKKKHQNHINQNYIKRMMHILFGFTKHKVHELRPSQMSTNNGKFRDWRIPSCLTVAQKQKRSCYSCQITLHTQEKNNQIINFHKNWNSTTTCHYLVSRRRKKIHT